MNCRTLRRLGYAVLALDGLLAALVPRIVTKRNLLPARLGFENVGDLEPRAWYVSAVRAAGVGMLAAGLTGWLLERPPEDGTEESAAELSAGEAGGTPRESHAEDDSSSGNTAA